MPKRAAAANATPLPAITPQPFLHQPELRALMILPALPPGHMTFLVQDDAFQPHLRRGEFAVVDLAGHQPAEGELFVISYRSRNAECGLTFAICQMRGRMELRRPDGAWTSIPDSDTIPAIYWTACHWLPPATREEYAAALRSGRVGTSEGPYTTALAAAKLVGRIVGVFVPAVEDARSIGGAHD